MNAKDTVKRVRDEAWLKEVRTQTLTAALAEIAGADFLALSQILGHEKTLALMTALPGRNITIPALQEVVDSLSTAAAALAVIQRRLTFDEARYHYQVTADQLRKVIEAVIEVNKVHLRKLGWVRDSTMHTEINRRFDILGQMEMDYF